MAPSSTNSGRGSLSANFFRNVGLHMLAEFFEVVQYSFQLVTAGVRVVVTLLSTVLQLHSFIASHQIAVLVVIALFTAVWLQG